MWRGFIKIGFFFFLGGGVRGNYWWDCFLVRKGLWRFWGRKGAKAKDDDDDEEEEEEEQWLLINKNLGFVVVLLNLNPLVFLTLVLIYGYVFDPTWGLDVVCNK
jgi:hypothetical protein